MKQMAILEEEYFNLRYKNKMLAILACYKKYKDITDIKEKKAFQVEIDAINNISNIKNECIKKQLQKTTTQEVTDETLKKLKQYFKKFHLLYSSYYNHSRITLFINPIKLLSWFKDQGDKCGYCAVSSKELQKIVMFREGNLTLNNGKKRSKGTLEIERTDSQSNEYSFNNVILACPLCNNAKSNLIDESSWRKYFAPSMRKYYESILNTKLQHQIKRHNKDVQ